MAFLKAPQSENVTKHTVDEKISASQKFLVTDSESLEQWM